MGKACWSSKLTINEQRKIHTQINNIFTEVFFSLTRFPLNTHSSIMNALMLAQKLRFHTLWDPWFSVSALPSSGSWLSMPSFSFESLCAMRRGNHFLGFEDINDGFSQEDIPIFQSKHIFSIFFWFSGYFIIISAFFISCSDTFKTFAWNFMNECSRHSFKI